MHCVSELPSEDEFASSGYYVAVRIRPSNEKERNGPYREVVRPCDDRVLVFDPRPGSDTGSMRSGDESSLHVPGNHRYKELRFVFDKIFSDSTMNLEVYRNTSRRLILPVLSGFRASMFAYGATGAGKSHTMTGNDPSCKGGVMSLTMSDFFDTINSPAYRPRLRNISVSYIEIYNENIHDLLSNTPQAVLPLREERGVGPVVSGLVEMHPQTYTDVMAILESGNSSRAKFATGENAQSSRSHAIFQVKVSLSALSAGNVGKVKEVAAESLEGKLSMIDLAGSERAKRTENTGIRFREGANINKSLLALGNCISALCHQSALGDKKKEVFVPYRNSKLTRILQDSLGGNSRTIMLANISPSSYSYEDTLNTLNYANRAKQIKTCAKANTSARRLTAVEYNAMIVNLKAENAALRARIQNLIASNNNSDSVGGNSNNNNIYAQTNPSVNTRNEEKEGEERKKKEITEFYERCVAVRAEITKQNKIITENGKQIEKMKAELWQTHERLKRVLKAKSIVFANDQSKKEQRELFEPSGKYYLIEKQLRKNMEIYLECGKKNQAEIRASKTMIDKIALSIDRIRSDFINSGITDYQNIKFTIDILADLLAILLTKIDQQLSMQRIGNQQQPQQQPQIQAPQVFRTVTANAQSTTIGLSNSTLDKNNEESIGLDAVMKASNYNSDCGAISNSKTVAETNIIEERSYFRDYSAGGSSVNQQNANGNNNRYNRRYDGVNTMISSSICAAARASSLNQMQATPFNSANVSGVGMGRRNLSDQDYSAVGRNNDNGSELGIAKETEEMAGKTLNILSDIGRQLSSIKTGKNIGQGLSTQLSSQINQQNRSSLMASSYSLNSSNSAVLVNTTINNNQKGQNQKIYGSTNNISQTNINASNSGSNMGLNKNKRIEKKQRKKNVSMNSSFVDDVIDCLPKMR